MVMISVGECFRGSPRGRNGGRWKNGDTFSRWCGQGWRFGSGAAAKRGNFIQLLPPTVTLDRKCVAVDSKWLREAHDDVVEALLSRVSMFMEPREERQARVESLKRDLEVMVRSSMESNMLRGRSQLLLELRM